MSQWTTCIRIQRTDGTVYGLTELDQDLNILGLTYVSAAGYTPSNYSSSDKMSVNHADIEGVLSVLGVTREEIRAGLFDFAEIEMFLWNYGDGGRVKTIGIGNWGEVTMYDGRYVAEFRSMTQRLQQVTGKLYTPHCTATFGDIYCKYDPTALIATGSVTTVVNRLTIVDSTRTEVDNYWKSGLITFTSGDNVGRSFEVDSSLATGALNFFLPLAFPAQVGDTYNVSPGCDKSSTMCIDRWNNIVNFRGFPYVPGMNTITRVGKEGYYPKCWEAEEPDTAPGTGRPPEFGEGGSPTTDVEVIDFSGAVTAIIEWGSTARIIETNLTAPDNTYDGFAMRFTSGPVTSYEGSFEITTQLQANGRLTLATDGLPYVPDVGNTIEIYHYEQQEYYYDGGG